MIKIVKRPAYDETFPSWLYRISITRSGPDYSAFSNALQALISRAPERTLSQSRAKDVRSSEGADFDYDMHMIQSVIDNYLAKFGIRLGFFEPRRCLILPYAMRNFYCPECLIDDVKTRGFPHWRKSWTYCMTAYCFEHKRLLVMSQANANAYDRAWCAFKEEICDTPFNAYWLIRDRLAIQIQRWYFGQPGFNDLGLKNVQSSTALFDLTYSLLLKCRTKFEDGGYACSLAREYRGQIIQKSLPLSERIKIGVNVSVPLQRSYALILTGIVLGLTSQPQISRFVRLARQRGIPWPSTPYEIGKMAILYASREEYLELRMLYSATPAHLIVKCAEFFKGLEHGVYSLRDEYSSRDREWLESGSPYERWLAPLEE